MCGGGFVDVVLVTEDIVHIMVELVHIMVELVHIMVELVHIMVELVHTAGKLFHPQVGGRQLTQSLLHQHKRPHNVDVQLDGIF